MQGNYGHANYQQHGSFAEAKEKVDIFVSCRKLRNLDVMSKTDPQGILYTKGQDGKYHEIDRTELIKDNLNPNFTHNFRVEYFFEVHQYFKIRMIDVDKNDYDMIGETEFKMADIMGSKEKSIKINLKYKGKNNGQLILRGEAVAQEEFDLRLECSGIKLKCFSMFSSIDPIIKFYKPRILSQDQTYLENLKSKANKYAGKVGLNSNDWVNVYTSKKGSGPNSHFPLISILSSKFCSSQLDMPLKVKLSNNNV